jgi:hypothetical protein
MSENKINDQKSETNQNHISLKTLGTLNSTQTRLFNSMQKLLPHILTTEDEGDFFENSRELFRLMAFCLQEANFEKKSQQTFARPIPYATQVLEFALDNLEEDLKNSKLYLLDN